MKVDFHVHSTASDGTFSPRGIAELVRGFRAVALTDHDNTGGVAEFKDAASGFSPVAGVELSIEPGKGFDKFHLLALGVDPLSPRLCSLMTSILDGRNARNAAILGNFRSIGIDIPPDALAKYANGDILARPHFARWLCDNGYASDVGSAFAKYLAPDSPPGTRCYENRWHPSQEDVFEAVHAAGGLCVMAHPKYWRASWRRSGVEYADAERELQRLKEAGLDGFEAMYQANTNEENVTFSMIASRTGLLKTAGSDFHGANKPGIPIGMDVSESFISPFLEALDLI